MVIRQRESDVAEARAIMQAIREFQTNPQLLHQSQADISAVLDNLKLSGTARHAIAATLAMGVGGVALMPGTPVFWSA